MVEGVFRRSRNSIRPIELGRRLIPRRWTTTAPSTSRASGSCPTISRSCSPPTTTPVLPTSRTRCAPSWSRPCAVRPRGGLPLHGPGRRRPARRQLAPGRFSITSRSSRARPAAAQARSSCRPATGSSSATGAISIGRLADCRIVISDGNISRHRAEIHRSRQRVRDQRPGLHERHLPERRATDRRPPHQRRRHHHGRLGQPPVRSLLTTSVSQDRPILPDSVLDILKLVLLVMLYLFFACVLFAVWSEVRQTANVRGPVERRLRPCRRRQQPSGRPQAHEGPRQCRPARRARAEAQAWHRVCDQRRDRHRAASPTTRSRSPTTATSRATTPRCRSPTA